MNRLVDRLRRALPASLATLAGVACAACCAIPALLTAGLVGGAGWAVVGRWMPGVAIVLVGLAGGAGWWLRRRRHRGGCPGGPECACSGV
jgi:mercuric ion transport protein